MKRHFRWLLALVSLLSLGRESLASPSQDLMLGAKSGRLTLMKNALRRGANINYQDDQGYTAIHHAIKLGQRNVVQFLLNAGAKVVLVTVLGASPLDLAHQQSDSEILQMVEEAECHALRCVRAALKKEVSESQSVETDSSD